MGAESMMSGKGSIRMEDTKTKYDSIYIRQLLVIFQQAFLP